MNNAAGNILVHVFDCILVGQILGDKIIVLQSIYPTPVDDAKQVAEVVTEIYTPTSSAWEVYWLHISNTWQCQSLQF